MLTLQELRLRYNASGLKLETYNPGEGLKVRVFKADDDSDFFGPSTSITTFCGRGWQNEADAWLSGYNYGRGTK